MPSVVDTSVLINVEKRKGSQALRGLLASEPDLAISTITISELLVGAYSPLADEPSRARTLRFTRLVMRAMRKLPIDSRVAKAHARLWVDLGKRVVEVEPNDLIIAATALSRGRSVITDEKGTFELIASVSDLDVKRFSAS